MLRLILTLVVLASNTGLISNTVAIDIDTTAIRIWAEIEISSNGVSIVEWGT